MSRHDRGPDPARAAGAGRLARSRWTSRARPSARSSTPCWSSYPSLRDQLLTPDGALNRFVNVYVNGRDVRYEQELATPVGAADTVVLLPAMAGG